MAKATIQLEGLACPSCLQKIEGATKSLNGVVKESVKVLFNAAKVKLDFDQSVVTIGEIEAAITKVGYVVKKSQVKE